MALVVSILQNKLKSLVVNSNNFPKSYELAASNFGNAVNDYGSLVTPPTPIAKTAMVAALNAAGEVAKNGGSAEAWAAAASMAIDTYFRTGTAVNSVSGVTVPWA